jgi:hypothetical protein
MGTATKSRFALVFVMMLTLGLGLGLAAKDIPETPYDESEALPYEAIPMFSIASSPAPGRTTPALLDLRPELSTPSSFPPARVRNTDANRSADARISLALLCALLC